MILFPVEWTNIHVYKYVKCFPKSQLEEYFFLDVCVGTNYTKKSKDQVGSLRVQQ